MNVFKLTPLCAALLVAALAGCDANDDADDVDLVPPAATAPDTELPRTGEDSVLTVGTGDEGDYLADEEGNAVYMLEGDTDGTVCVGDCLEAWPPVIVDDPNPVVDPGLGLDPALLGTIERPDGSLQLTYNGRPLYRYSADTSADPLAGQGIEDDWGHWYLVTPTGVEVGPSVNAEAAIEEPDDGNDGIGDSSVAEDATQDDGPGDTSATERD